MPTEHTNDSLSEFVQILKLSSIEEVIEYFLRHCQGWVMISDSQEGKDIILLKHPERSHDIENIKGMTQRQKNDYFRLSEKLNRVGGTDYVATQLELQTLIDDVNTLNNLEKVTSVKELQNIKPPTSPYNFLRNEYSPVL